jgi:aspartate kinase
MLVMKFGGSSVESAQAIRRVAGIISREERPLVVVSAMGKTTNRLLEIANCAVYGEGEKALELLSQLKAYTVGEACGADVEGHFVELSELVKGLSILGELTPRSLDLIASFGERISSIVVAHVLNESGIRSVRIDSREILKTDNRFTGAVPLFEETEKLCCEILIPQLEQSCVVVGGFIGSTTSGETTTLGRGGSDYSAAIFGSCLKAQEIQIWTDVDGMLTCDPRLLPGGKRIKRISFHEAAELAYFGAKVLHPATVLPAIDSGIPVRVLNSRNPECEGTLIVADEVSSTQNIFKSIACKQSITSIHIHSTRMLMAYGFLQRIFDVFERHETPVDLIATSEVSVSVTVDNTDRIPWIVEELKEFSEVSVEEEQSIISLVGDGLTARTGVLARIFGATKEIPVRMVSQGASNRNVSFVVKDSDLLQAVKNLHVEFFSELDSEVFDG